MKFFSKVCLFSLVFCSLNLYAGFFDDVVDVLDTVVELDPQFYNIQVTDKVVDEIPVRSNHIFSENTQRIYLFVGVKNINPSSPVSAIWYYNSNGIWADFGTFSVKIPKGINIAHYYVDKPENRSWPIGEYKVDIKYQNTVRDNVTFKVKKSNNEPAIPPIPVQPATLKTHKYTNRQIGLEITYPENMEIQSDETAIKVVNPLNNQSIVIKQLNSNTKELIEEKEVVDSQKTRQSNDNDDDFEF